MQTITTISNTSNGKIKRSVHLLEANINNTTQTRLLLLPQMPYMNRHKKNTFKKYADTPKINKSTKFQQRLKSPYGSQPNEKKSKYY